MSERSKGSDSTPGRARQRPESCSPTPLAVPRNGARGAGKGTASLIWSRAGCVGWVERSETHQSRPHHRADRGIAPLTTTIDGLRLRLNPSYATLPDLPHGKIRPSEVMARVRFPCPSGRAEERRAMGGQGHCKMPLLRELTRCGCLNVENATGRVGWVERSETHQSRLDRRTSRGIAPLTTTTDGLRLRLNPSYAT